MRPGSGNAAFGAGPVNSTHKPLPAGNIATGREPGCKIFQTTRRAKIVALAVRRFIIFLWRRTNQFFTAESFTDHFRLGEEALFA